MVGLEKEIAVLRLKKKADLVILNLHQFHAYPSAETDPISIVYSAGRSDVVTTIINGKIVMEKGVMKTMNKEFILPEAIRSINRLLKRAALT